ncbi:MAG: ATPase domain-containing protein [Candidatus Bathyarchaeia archaeon]
MASESDVVGFLKFHRRRATLQEIAEGLGIKKYGTGSAFVLLQGLKSKGLVDREGENWILKTETGTERSEGPEEGAVGTEVQRLVQSLVKELASAVGEARRPADEWQMAGRPFEEEATAEVAREVGRYVVKPSKDISVKRPLKGFPTGTFLDKLFLSEKGDPIGGVPSVGQIAITGLPGGGKSILVIEIALNAAHQGKKVLFVTSEDTWASETERYDLQSRFMDKARIMGLNWKRISENMFIMDTITSPELREWEKFVETYRYITEKEKIDLVIIDSVTILEAYRGALKYRTMELARYNQIHGITGLFVNQRSSDRWDVHDMAGGIGLAHALDGTVIVDYGHVYFMDQQQDLEAGRGEFVRIARVIDCRLCNYVRKRIRITITDDGFVKPIEPIAAS